LSSSAGPAEAFDAVVVGAGACGTYAAMDLTRHGLRVALLDAGPNLPFPAVVPPDPGAPLASERQPVQAHCYAHGERTAHLFVDDLDNPYTFPPDKPFDWIRGRQVGGRLHTWGRMCLRMSDGELKAASRDGIGEDWPIGYADLAPYYDRVETDLGVCGAPEGLPQVPDGSFVSPPHLSSGERRFKAAVEAAWPTRRVIGARIALASPGAALAAAQASGRLTLLPDAVASEVTSGADGRAEGVVYVEREGGARRTVRGRLVFLCASAIESTRLLLHSESRSHPNGLGNSSGLVGRYLMDHTYGIGLRGVAPQRVEPSGSSTLYGCAIPGFRNITEPVPGFARSYGVELQVHTPEAGLVGRLRARRRQLPGAFWMSCFGEVLPRYENRVTLDRARTDAWGIPVAHVECAYGENERAMAADQVACLTEMATAAGLEIEETFAALGNPGLSVHEMGTARMGADAAESVLNGYAQSWDVPNLYVTDGASFVSGGFQNPTLTMLAITARACEHAVEQLRTGAL
jgi:choline dehydrogenase-like flavoprotein